MPVGVENIFEGMRRQAAAEEKRFEKLIASEDKVLKFCIGGNAGGAIALVGLIGSYVTRQPGTFPENLYWLLVTFIVGLVAGWVCLISDLRRVRSAISEGPRTLDGEKDAERLYQQIDRHRDIGLWLSSFALIFGGVGSLSMLYGMTR